MRIRGPALSYDLALEPSIVVDVDDTRGPRRKAGSYKLVILSHGSGVEQAGGRGQRTRRDVGDSSAVQVVAVDQELPCHWQPKCVQAILLRKMLHLRRAVDVTFANGQHRTKAVGEIGFALDVGAEIEAGYVDSLQDHVRENGN